LFDSSARRLLIGDIKVNKKKIVRFDFWLNPAFDEKMSATNEVELTVLRQTEADEKNFAALKQANVYHICAARDEVPQRFWVTEELLKQCPDLLCASSSGAGYDPIDLDACTRHGVLVVNQSGCNADSVAEHAMGLLLSVKHRITESDRVMRANAYTTREDLMGREIKGLTIGLIGMGNIGRRVAKLASAFGMKVIASDPHLSAAEIEKRGALSMSFQNVLAQADVVSVHCPRSPETLNMFGAKEFQSMKPGAVFMSTARGGIHDEQALIDALKDGHLSGAGLDVWTVEPPAKGHTLLTLPNVVATYHTAGVTHEARRNAAVMAADQIAAMLKGEPAPRMANPEVWPLFLERLNKKVSA
jgi:D-3-phosphoglycerate dehydrogenase